jgi:hypothetical protein
MLFNKKEKNGTGCCCWVSVDKWKNKKFLFICIGINITTQKDKKGRPRV